MITFGCAVTITAIYKRHYSNRYASWKLQAISETEGIFLGYRTLQNGETYYDSDYGTQFHAVEYIKAALVCTSPYRNPIYVPIDNIERKIK